jgi:hypothetical protein
MNDGATTPRDLHVILLLLVDSALQLADDLKGRLLINHI